MSDEQFQLKLHRTTATRERDGLVLLAGIYQTLTAEEAKSLCTSQVRAGRCGGEPFTVNVVEMGER